MNAITPKTQRFSYTFVYKIDLDHFVNTEKYGVSFREYFYIFNRIYKWQNPDVKTSHGIVPYVPLENIKSTFVFNKKIKDNGLPCIFNNEEILFAIFSILEPKAIVNFSEVSIGCYLATKSDFIWRTKLKKLLPKVNCMSIDCMFSPEQQFQILFKRIEDRRKRFNTEFKHTNKLIRKLKSNAKPHEYFAHKSRTIAIEITELESELLKPNRMIDDIKEILNLKAREMTLNSAHAKENKILSEKIEELAQKNKRCRHAIRSIPKEYNQQHIFDIVIRSSESAKKNLCTPTVNQPSPLLINFNRAD